MFLRVGSQLSSQNISSNEISQIFFIRYIEINQKYKSCSTVLVITNKASDDIDTGSAPFVLTDEAESNCGGFVIQNEVLALLLNNKTDVACSR